MEEPSELLSATSKDCIIPKEKSFDRFSIISPDVLLTNNGDRLGKLENIDNLNVKTPQTSVLIKHVNNVVVTRIEPVLAELAELNLPETLGVVDIAPSMRFMWSM